MPRSRYTLGLLALLLLPLAGLRPADGASLDPPIRLETATSQSFHPTVALGASGNVVMLWHGFLANRVSHLYTGSPDGSEIPPPPVKQDSVDARLVAAPGGDLHVVYRAGGDRKGDIFWIRYRSGHWSAPRNLSRSPGDSRYPDLARHGNVLVALWEDRTGGKPEFWFSRSADGGDTWLAARPTGIARDLESFQGTFSLAFDSGGHLHLVWQDGATSASDIYHSILRAGRWSPRGNVSRSPGEFSGEPSLATAGRTVQAVWVEQDREDGRVFDVARASFGPDGLWRRLAAPRSSGSVVFRPQIVEGAPGTLTLLFERLTKGGRELLLSQAPFLETVRLSGELKDPRRAAAVFDRLGALHVVFDAEGVPGDRAIYYRRRD